MSTSLKHCFAASATITGNNWILYSVTLTGIILIGLKQCVLKKNM